MEGGRIQYSGHAQELREDPKLLHSAYLLRARGNGASATAQPLPAQRMSAGLGVTELEHVLVLSADIDRAREFYERALGLRAGDRPPLRV